MAEARSLTLYEVQLPLREELARIELQYFTELLKKYPPDIRGNISAAAKEAGLDVGNFNRLLTKRPRGARWLVNRGHMSIMFVKIPGMSLKIGGRKVTKREARRAQRFDESEIRRILQSAADFINVAHKTGCALRYDTCTCERDKLVADLRTLKPKGLVTK